MNQKPDPVAHDPARLLARPASAFLPRDVTVPKETAKETAKELAKEPPRELLPKETHSATPKLLGNFIDFCRHSAIAMEDPMSVIKIVLANTKSIDREAVYSELFPDAPVIMWEFTDQHPGNSIGDFSQCICLAEYLAFPNSEATFKPAADRLLLISAFLRDLRACGLAAVQFHTALAMLLLFNMKEITGSNVLEQYTTRVLKRPTHDEVMRLMAKLADYRFKTADYNASITWILQQTHVNERFFHEVRMLQAQRETIESGYRQRHLALTSGRPRMTERLQRIRKIASVTTENGVLLTGEAMDTFDGWVTRVRFPNTISSRLKRRLYLAMAMPCVDTETVVREYAHPGIAEDVLRQPVTVADAAAVVQTILQLNIQMAPFPELMAFQRSCFRAFPERNAREMTILRYMQLYIAAYQQPPIWKECWTGVYPLLTYQIIKDVEDFVQRTKFNNAMFVAILRTN